MLFTPDSIRRRRAEIARECQAGTITEGEAGARLTEADPDFGGGYLLLYDYDDLNARAGGHSWGYVEPTETAWELLEEAVEPVLSEMKRYLEIELEEQAREFCHGILLPHVEASLPSFETACAICVHATPASRTCCEDCKQTD